MAADTQPVCPLKVNCHQSPPWFLPVITPCWPWVSCPILGKSVPGPERTLVTSLAVSIAWAGAAVGCAAAVVDNAVVALTSGLAVGSGVRVGTKSDVAV